jgi:hypothetical protein
MDVVYVRVYDTFSDIHIGCRVGPTQLVSWLTVGFDSTVPVRSSRYVVAFRPFSTQVYVHPPLPSTSPGSTPHRSELSFLAVAAHRSTSSPSISVFPSRPRDLANVRSHNMPFQSILPSTNPTPQ